MLDLNSSKTLVYSLHNSVFQDKVAFILDHFLSVPSTFLAILSSPWPISGVHELTYQCLRTSSSWLLLFTLTSSSLVTRFRDFHFLFDPLEHWFFRCSKTIYICINSARMSLLLLAPMTKDLTCLLILLL